MPTHDFIAIGLGPANLSLACLTEPIDELDGLFLESKPDFDWHPGMLLESATLQTPFIADLVTLADPTSPYSFLSYLKETGRLYSFYIRENFYPVRSEYNAYCRWAAAKLRSVRFGHDVTRVEYDDADGLYTVHAVSTATGENTRHRARHLVLGTGTPPYIPDSCEGLGGDVIHNSGYLDGKAALQAKESITVVGSGQSAAEIYADLLADTDTHGYRLNWVTRSPRFFPLEYTKLTLEMTSPEYVDYFHALPEETRYRLESEQKGLFKGIDAELINGIFDLLYEKSVKGPVPTRLLTNTALSSASYDEASGRYTLGLHHAEQDRDFELTTQGLVLATGYRYRPPAFLEPVRDRIRWDGRGRFDVARNYSIDLTGNGIFLQNAGTHTHSITSPDLGMGPYRNSWIIRELLGREHYPVERAIAFQEFGAPEVPDDEIVFSRTDAALGQFAVRPVDPDTDAAMLHSWVTHPKASFWQMGDADLAEVAREYRRISEHPHHDAYIGLHEGNPAFLVERYNPAEVELPGLYDHEEGDVGMHFLCAPTGTPVHGFTRAVITTAMELLFADQGTRRVVVEPDVRNTAVHALNAAVGFEVAARITKPEKEALLSVCTRNQFLNAGATQS